jgi:hypothetical protein
MADNNCSKKPINFNLSPSKSAININNSSVNLNFDQNLTLSNEHLNESLLSTSSSKIDNNSASKLKSTNLYLNVPRKRFIRSVVEVEDSQVRISKLKSGILEENELIGRYQKLFNNYSLKSFSTSDLLVKLETVGHSKWDSAVCLTDSCYQQMQQYQYSSQSCGNNLPFNGLTIKPSDLNSRSCSTWAMIGDDSTSLSQLPSPQSHACSLQMLPFLNSLDLIISMNRLIRQVLIKKRLETIFKTLNHLSLSICKSSELNLDQTHFASPRKNKLPSSFTNSPLHSMSLLIPPSSSTILQTKISSGDQTLSITNELENLNAVTSSLSFLDIDRKKGKPLTKYERNVMISNWLQNGGSP